MFVQTQKDHAGDSPCFTLGEEDEDAEDDAGQSDAHANDDPRHGLLVDVVQAVDKCCRDVIVQYRKGN